MEIEYLGHSCFKFTEGGFSLVIDPYLAGSVPGLAPIKEKANQVISSHKHGDHFGIKEVKLAFTRADTPFMLDFIPTWHDDKQGELRGENNIIIVNVGYSKIVHMGDIGCQITDEELEAIKGCDVLLIPVGGFFTIDAKEALKYVERIKPGIVIPMHYRKDSIGYDMIATSDEFIKLCEEGGYPISEEGSVMSLDVYAEVTEDGEELPDDGIEGTLVCVMEPSKAI